MNPTKKSFSEKGRVLSTRKRGKVFYRFLLSYLAILLLPLLLSFIVFSQSHDLLREEAKRANTLLLNQLKAYCDETVNDALSLTTLISNSDRVNGIIYEKGPVDSNILYKAYSTVNDFIDYHVANRNVISFYMYLPALDLIVSPFGFHSTDNYYDNVLMGLDYTYDEWISHFIGIKGRYFSPFQTTDDSGKKIGTLALFSPLPVTSTTGDAKAACVVEVDLAHFSGLMKDTVWTERSILAIYDRDRGILLSSREDLVTDRLIDQMNDPEFDKKDTMFLELEGVRYALHLTHSDVVRWTYISLIPTDIYNDRFISLYKLIILFFGIFAFFGGGLVYYTTQKRYKPIKDMLGLIQPVGNEDVTLSLDEYNMISRGIQLTMDEDSRLKREMEENRPILQQRELRRLLKGDISWSGDEESRLGKLGLRFDKSLFLLILLDIEPEEDAPASLREECIAILHEQGNKSEFMYQIKDLDGHVAYLINRNEKRYNEILEALTLIRDQIEETHSVAVAMGLSHLHPRADGFEVLYWEAALALSFRLVKGRSQPILFEDIQKATHTYYYPLEEEKRFIAAIRSGTEKDAFDILESIISQNFDKDSLMSVPMARCLMNDLIATLIKGINGFLSESDDRFWADLKPVSRLTKCKSFENLKTEMEDILYRVCSHIRKGQKSHNDKLKEGIIAYIKENYEDMGLCVDSIAGYFDRNSAYLARFFKEQTSLGLAAYIKQYRILQSLKLLTDDRKTVAAIAEEVGFSNANAFIRAFKEIEGMTPGQYRENQFA